MKNFSNFTTHFTDMCIPNFFSLPNDVRRLTFDTVLVTKFGAFSSFHQYFLNYSWFRVSAHVTKVVPILAGG
jgi:hypothetical protein